MKQKISLSIFMTMLSLLSFAQTGVINVNALQFNELAQSGNGIVLDVRTPGEYQRGHIEGSTLISIADPNFVSKTNMLQKDKALYIYCLTGSRSRVAANYLAKNGFSEVYNLQRGIIEWQQRGLPIATSKAPIASKSKIYSIDEYSKMTSAHDVVLIDFHAPWCAPCKKMLPTIDKVASEYHGKIRVEKVDVDANKQIAQHKNIGSIPGFVLYKNGEEVWRHKGVITYDELTAIFEQWI